MVTAQDYEPTHHPTDKSAIYRGGEDKKASNIQRTTTVGQAELQKERTSKKRSVGLHATENKEATTNRRVVKREERRATGRKRSQVAGEEANCKSGFTGRPEEKYKTTTLGSGWILERQRRKSHQTIEGDRDTSDGRAKRLDRGWISEREKDRTHGIV